MQEAAIIQSEKDSEGHRLHEGEMREDPNFLGHAQPTQERALGATDPDGGTPTIDFNTPEKEEAVEKDMQDAAIVQSEKDSEGHRLHEGEMREDPNYLGHKPTREEIKAKRDLQRAKMTAKRELAEAKRQEKTSAIVAAKRKEADAKRALAEAQKELKAIVDSDIGHRGCGKLNIC